MDEVNVAVIAPILGRDLSFVSDVDPRVRVFDANFAAPGRRAGSGGPAPGPDQLADILAQAEVLLVGYPVPEALAARSPRLVWAHHTQAGVSNLAGSDLWASEITLTSSRGVVAATAIAEYAVAAAAHFARGLHEAARQKAAGQFTRQGYQMLTLRGATMGIIGLGGIGQEVARLSRAAGMRVIGTRRSVTAPLPDADGADLVLPADRGHVPESQRSTETDLWRSTFRLPSTWPGASSLASGRLADGYRQSASLPSGTAWRTTRFVALPRYSVSAV